MSKFVSISLAEASKIAGNASPRAKQIVANIMPYNHHTGSGFAISVGNRIKVVEVSVNKMSEDDVKMQGRVVCEIVTSEDMLNGGGNVHGGCTAYLIDMCTSMAFPALAIYNGGESKPSVSQAINTVYHGPAQLGDVLKIVSTTITMGARILTANCEIWNVTKHRLVATGVHVKMAPSPNPKL